jgi:hypothetical protein
MKQLRPRKYPRYTRWGWDKKPKYFSSNQGIGLDNLIRWNVIRKAQKESHVSMRWNKSRHENTGIYLRMNPKHKTTVIHRDTAQFFDRYRNWRIHKKWVTSIFRSQ